MWRGKFSRLIPVTRADTRLSRWRAIATGTYYYYYYTNISRTLLFWTAFILTRPLGATAGDLLDKPVSHGGLALSRYWASAALAAFILGCILVLPQRAGQHPVVQSAAE